MTDEELTVDDARFSSSASPGGETSSGNHRPRLPRRPAARRRSAAGAAAGDRPRERSGGMGTFLGVVFLLAFATGLVAMAALVMPDIVYLALVLLGCFLFGWLHYALWGRWLSLRPPADAELDDRE